MKLFIINSSLNTEREEEEEEAKVPDTPRSSARLESKRPGTPTSGVGSPGGGRRPTTPSRKTKAGPTEGSEDPYDFKVVKNVKYCY